jgi:predicted DNA-binding protein
MSATKTDGETEERKKSPAVGFVCPPEMKEKIQRFAEEDRRTVSQYLRILVEECLVREEKARYGDTKEAS